MTRHSLYGSGLFTTIRIVDGKPWLWDKHWRRLMHDAARLGIDITSSSEYMVRRGLDESIPDSDKNKRQKARITITDLHPSPLWSAEKPAIPSNIEFLVSPLRDVPQPFRIGISPHAVNSTSPIAGLKTCNYLEQTMSLDEVKARGFNEAVRLNERGHVTSACMANVFWSKDGELSTPALKTGCLPGTTRDFVLENLNVREVEANIDQLKHADAIYLTSAGLGVIAVDEFDGRTLTHTKHAITDLLALVGSDK